MLNILHPALDQGRHRSRATAHSFIPQTGVAIGTDRRFQHFAVDSLPDLRQTAATGSNAARRLPGIARRGLTREEEAAERWVLDHLYPVHPPCRRRHATPGASLTAPSVDTHAQRRAILRVRLQNGSTRRNKQTLVCTLRPWRAIIPTPDRGAASLQADGDDGKGGRPVESTTPTSSPVATRERRPLAA